MAFSRDMHIHMHAWTYVFFTYIPIIPYYIVIKQNFVLHYRKSLHVTNVRDATAREKEYIISSLF